MKTNNLTPEERRIGMSLAAIFGLRMLGLFLILPVFAIFASNFPGGDDVTMIGIAIGAYGLTQACLQIIYGAASDRWGRKPVIVFGLILFIVGSVIAALADHLNWIIVGRVIQGAGAISAAVTALASDLIPPEKRTRVMAMIGSSIGLVFALSLVMAPILYSWVGMAGIFWLTAAMALGAIVLLLKVVPPAPPIQHAAPVPLAEVLFHPQLARLNFGVFALHLTQTALWVLIPSALVVGGLEVSEHWKIYLPAVLLSFVIMVPAIIRAEKHGQMKSIFTSAVVLLLVVSMGFYQADATPLSLGLWLTLFFVAFNILEATQPSLISRIAPPQAKGKALGLYNTLQAIGLFAGGSLGGWIAKNYGGDAVFLFCALLAIGWLGLVFNMNFPAQSKPAPV
ncbi:MAG: hypothetical protein RIR18_668 [Pseudomonadota bacterium]|jgi:MFS family permease